MLEIWLNPGLNLTTFRGTEINVVNINNAVLLIQSILSLPVGVNHDVVQF